MEKHWEKLKKYMDEASNAKSHECGHAKVSGFREVRKLMSLIENGEDEGIVIDNTTFKFENTGASIVFGKDFKMDE